MSPLNSIGTRVTRATTGLGWLLLAGSSLHATAAAATTDTTPPVIVGGPVIFANPNPAVPLAALVRIRTDEPTSVTLFFDDGVQAWSVLADPVFATTHRAPALGMRPDRTYTIQVTVADEAGNSTTSPVLLDFTTGPLPQHFPFLQLNQNPQARIEPGVTLFNMFYGTHNNPNVIVGTFLTMVDENGEVVWFYDSPYTLTDVNRMRNGHFIVYFGGSRRAMEIDVFGNTVQEWWAAGLGTAGAPPGVTMVPIDTFHHELDEAPEGDPADFIGLTSELRLYPNYPIDEVNQSITEPIGKVIGDVIVEWKRDGTVLSTCKLLDVLDPYRVCYGSTSQFWDPTYGLTGTHDWAHANAVFIDPSDDTYVVSLRHQDAVVKIRRNDKSLVWILGPHGLWNPPWTSKLLTPVPNTPFEWNYHQHAPAINGHGNVVLFDNGNFRATPPAIALPSSQWYSRAGEYAINTTNMSVLQAWTFGGRFDPFTPPWFSGFLGETDSLPETDNILVTSGAQADPDVSNQTFSRIEEVTRTRPPIQLWELIVRDDPLATVHLNYNVYRSERLPGVYPY